MKKIVALLLAVMMVVGMFTACSTETQSAAAPEKTATEEKTPTTEEKAPESEETVSAESSESADTTKAPEGMVLGYINYTDALDTPMRFHKGVEKICEENGIKVIYAEASGSETEMMAACDNFILQGADIIVDSNWNVAGGSALVQKCNDAGIPLISVDTLYEGENSYFVGVDNDNVGVLAGQAAAKYIEKKFEGQIDYVVASFSASLGAINTRTTNGVKGIREAGYSVPDENYFELECGSGDATQMAKQQMTDWLTAHPDGTVAVIAGNTEMGLGFQAAIESQNRADDCIIVSCGLDTNVESAFKEGSDLWVAAIDFMCDYYGETLVPLAIRLVNGERPSEIMNYVQIRYIDAENYADFYG